MTMLDENLGLLVTRTTIVGAAMLLFAACGGGGSGPRQVEEVVFEEQLELLPGFSFDTGLQPPGSPVQASFAVSAKGTITVGTVAAPSGSGEMVTLSGLPGRGLLEVEGGFSLDGHLVVDVTGIPSYEGPIPGIENVAIEIAAQSAFDPFSLGEEVVVRADIPATRLPSIPLPGGLPGSLVVQIAEGSFLDVSLSGQSACIEDREARYAVAIGRTGALVLRPSVEFELPLIGTEVFEIPEVSVDLAMGVDELAMTAEIVSFGARPAEGDHVEGTCSGHGSFDTEGGDTGGQATTGETSGATSEADDTGDPTGDPTGDSCSTNDDCAAKFTCIDAVCVPSNVCGSQISYVDHEINVCATRFCCDHFDACTYGGTDEDGCKACLDEGGGPRCDGFIACLQDNCTGPYHPICDSGLGTADPDVSACLTASCCAEFNACTMNGQDPAACSDCIQQGFGPLCDAALSCLGGCLASCDHDECTEGTPLAADCSACTQAVCDLDSYCCSTAWDQVCVDAVATTAECAAAGITCP